MSQNLPSLESLAQQKLPLNIPWHREFRALGDGFESRLMNMPQGPWTNASPFDAVPSEGALYVRDVAGGTYSYRDATSSGATENSDHLSANLGVSVGNALASVGVSGQYDKDVMDLSNNFMASRNATARVGRVLYTSSPVLSRTAKRLLAYPNGDKLFRQQYGDYYLAGYQLGADAGGCLCTTSSSHDSSMSLHVEIQVKVLIFEGSATAKDEHEEEHLAQGHLTFSSYDTLRGNIFRYEVSKYGNLGFLRDSIDDVMRRADSLLADVLDELQKNVVADGRPVSPEACQKMCESGIVCELIVLPYASVSDFRGVRR